MTGDAALVGATTQDIAGLVAEKEVQALPLNGRSRSDAPNVTAAA